MADTVRTQQELLSRMRINVAGVQVGRRADINVQTFRDFVVSIPTLGAPGLSNIVEDLSPQLGGVLDQNGFDIKASDARGPCIQDADSLLNAVINPNKADLDTGVGWRAANQFDLIAGTVSKMTLGTSLIRMRDNVSFQAAGGTQIQNEDATTINPVFLPHGSDPDTGLGGVLNTSLNAIVNGSSKMQWGTSLTIFAQTLAAAVSGGPTVRNATATVTGPVFNPHSSLPNSGMGGDASGNVSMITNALERMRFSNAGLISFFQNMAANIATGPLIKNEAASSSNPTLVPDQAVPTTGIGKSGSSLDLIAAGEARLRIGTGPGNPNVVFQPINTSGLLIGSVSGSFGLHNVASSATVPSLLNSFSSEVAGIGGITGACTMIAASLERITVNATGIGFFATTPAARPTGVAVTAAAIHAALVTLGLITA